MASNTSTASVSSAVKFSSGEYSALRKKAEIWQQDDVRCTSLNHANQSICCFIQLETDSIEMMWSKSDNGVCHKFNNLTGMGNGQDAH